MTSRAMRRHWSKRLLTHKQKWRQRRYVTLSDAQALVDTMADSLAELEAARLAATLSDAQALVDTLGDSQGEVEGQTLGDKLSDAQALFDTLVDS